MYIHIAPPFAPCATLDRVLQCVAVCCSMLQYLAVCCSMW